MRRVSEVSKTECGCRAKVSRDGFGAKSSESWLSDDLHFKYF